MASMRASLSVSGTLLEREGRGPLVAVSAMLGDRLVQAAVVDPSEVDLSQPIELPPVRLPTTVDTVNMTHRIV